MTPTTAVLSQGNEYQTLLASDSLRKMKSQVVFIPGETIRLWDRILVIRQPGDPDLDQNGHKFNRKEVTRGRLMRVISNEYRQRKIDAETYDPEGQPSFTRERKLNPVTMQIEEQIILPIYQKFAWDSAEELEGDYAARGLVWIKELEGLSDDAIRFIESVVLPMDKEGNVEVPETLQAFQEHIDRLSVGGVPTDLPPEARAVIDATVKALRASLRQSFAYMTEKVDKIETELFNRRHNANAQGVMALDEFHLNYFRMLGRVPQDKQITDIAENSRMALMNALSVGKSPVVTASGAKCPFCASNISDDAVKCHVCHEWIDEEAEVAYNSRKAKRNGNGTKPVPKK